MRRLTTFLLLLTIAVLLKAQGWNPVDEHEFNDETIVYVRLSTGDASADNDATRYVVGAFIGGECRATAESSVGDDGLRLYVLRVHGDRDADRGQTITFEVYDRTQSFAHEATPSRAVAFTGESEGTPSNCIIQSFDPRFEPLQGFRVTVDALYAGQTGQLTLTPIPADATYKVSDISVDFTCTPAHWQAVDVVGQTQESAPTMNYELSTINYTITPLVPGRIGVTFSGVDVPFYDATGEQPFTSFTVAAPVHLQEGWQWLTNAFASVQPLDLWTVYGGNALTEIRTQDHLLYNDPEWGYFGTLMDDGLPQNTAYKVLMAQGPHVGCLWDGHFAEGFTFAVDGMWTWMPSPYFYDRLLSNAFPTTAELPVGMVIISKERGSAEWDGTSWVGDLQVMPAGESLLCYNPSDASVTLSFANEMTMAQGHETSVLPLPTVAATPWHYDASAYSDNMTMVASMPDLLLASDYALGAFVGGECRGEGHYVDGLFFVTIHGHRGERISFRLCHLPSGQQYEVDETLTGDRRMGSLSEPVVLHSSEQTTSLTPGPSPRGEGSDCSAVYDAAGRLVGADSRVGPSPHGGIRIVKYTDGRVGKVLQ